METTTAPPSPGTVMVRAIFVGLTWVLTAGADLFVLLLHTSTCDQAADASTVWHGRLALLLVLVVALASWLTAAVLGRDPVAGVAAAVVAVLPAIGFLAYGFSEGAWVTSSCWF